MSKAVSLVEFKITLNAVISASFRPAFILFEHPYFFSKKSKIILKIEKTGV